MYQQQPYNQYEEQPPSTTEIIISNILKAVVCIFLIVIGFFLVVLLVSSLNTQSAVEFTTYTHQFTITNPLLTQVVFTGNPLLSSIVLTKYNASNSSYGGVPSTSWSYDDERTSIEITAGTLEHTITGLLVTADTDYSEPPTESVLTAWAVALIVMCMAAIFGVIAYSRWR